MPISSINAAINPAIVYGSSANCEDCGNEKDARNLAERNTRQSVTQQQNSQAFQNVSVESSNSRPSPEIQPPSDFATSVEFRPSATRTQGSQSSGDSIFRLERLSTQEIPRDTFQSGAGLYSQTQAIDSRNGFDNLVGVDVFV